MLREGGREPGVVRHAVVGAARAAGARPHARPRAGAARWCEWARAAGFDQVSLDLIYGTPGESLDDWAASLAGGPGCEPDHLSAYALIVEEGTALARRIRRGEVAMTDDDDLADKYLAADETLTAAGLRWYEVSNWARTPEAACRHNLLLLDRRRLVGRRPGRAQPRPAGCGGGTSSTPTAYAARIADGVSPAHGRELLDDETRRVERVLLETRLAQGLPTDVLDDAGRALLPALVERGLVEEAGARAGAGRAHHPRPAARRRGGARPAQLMKRMLIG